MSDAFTGVFDDLEPSQFYFTGTAVLDEELPPCGLVQFVNLHKLILRAQYAAAGGQPNPVIFLADETRTKGFVAQDGEDMEAFTMRLHGEAAEMGAHRLFFYRQTMVGSVSANMPAAQEMLSESIDECASDAVTLHNGIIWCAEERDQGEKLRIAGIMELADDERLIDTRMYTAQPIAVLDKILG